MKKILSFVTICSIAISALAFEGEVSIHYMGNTEQKENFNLTWYFSAGKYRLDVLYAGSESNGKASVFLPNGGNKVIIYNTNPSAALDYKYFNATVDKVPTVEEYKVIPTEETKTIAGFVCKKYVFKSFTGKTVESWITQDIDIDWTTIAAPLRMLPEARIMAKYEITGFPLETITRDESGVVAQSTLISIKQRPQAQELFVIPEGYSEMEQQK